MIAGRVSAQEDGRPLAGTTVGLVLNRNEMPRLLPISVTDSSGSFRLTELPAGRHNLYAVAADRAPLLTGIDAKRTTETFVTLELSPGKPVRGRVVDNRGNAVDGAVVRAHTWKESSVFQRTTVTDAEGLYELSHMPEEAVGGSVRREGVAAPQQIEVRGGQDDAVTTLTLLAGIAGRVVDSVTRQPLPVYDVLIGSVTDREKTPRWLERTFTVRSQTGAFDIRHEVGAAESLKIRIRAPGYISEELGRVLSAGDTMEGVEIELHKGVTCRGIVVDSEGRPVSGAQIRLFDSSNRLRLGKYRDRTGYREWAVSREDGRFELAGVPETPFHLYAAHPTAGSSLLVDLEPDTTVTRVVLQPFGAVEGYVYRGHNPGQHMQVQLVTPWESDSAPVPQLMWPATTDQNGYFRMEGIPAGAYTLLEAIRFGQYTTAYGRHQGLQVHPGESTVVRLGGEGGARIHGVVTDQTGKPAAGLKVQIARFAEAAIHIASTRTDGSYEIFDVPPGEYSISAEWDFSVPEERVYGWKSSKIVDDGEVECNLTVAPPERRKPAAVD